VLELVGWPHDRAVSISQAIAESLASGASLSPDLIGRWSPMIGELSTGNYLAAAIDLPIERVVKPKHSWWYLRTWDRETFEGDAEFEDAHPHHYQGPRFPFDDIGKTYWMVMPSQNPEHLDESRVTHFVDMIRVGQRPSVLSLGWRDRRHVQLQFPECFLILCVLDGHHTLEAYARCGQPARVIGLFRLEDCRGDPADRSRELIGNLRQLRQEQGQMASDVYWREVDWLDGGTPSAE